MRKTNDFELLLDATRNAFKVLFKEHNENFYYATLILSEGGTPFISALSEEVLKNLSEGYTDEALKDYKWSYADSPYCGYGFEEYFGELNKLFYERMKSISTDKGYEKEITHWLSDMEKVMKTLDEEKVFGEGEKRDKMIINAEIMPPEESNAKRAKRLNKKSTYEKWYKDNF